MNLPHSLNTFAPVFLPSDALRSTDRELLRVLRGNEAVCIEQLIQTLGVTATAVRQRIQRLLEMGLIDREKIVAGRGRPTYRYRLTVLGHRQAGANAADLADAMWQEILLIEDQAVQEPLLMAIASRLGRQYAAELDHQGDANPPVEMSHVEIRLHQLSMLLSEREMSSEVSHAGDLPVLDLNACPYPTLTDVSDNRAMCRLEEQMFSEALGQPVELSLCRLDGDPCCQFSPVGPPSQP